MSHHCGGNTNKKVNHQTHTNEVLNTLSEEFPTNIHGYYPQICPRPVKYKSRAFHLVSTKKPHETLGLDIRLLAFRLEEDRGLENLEMIIAACYFLLDSLYQRIA